MIFRRMSYEDIRKKMNKHDKEHKELIKSDENKASIQQITCPICQSKNAVFMSKVLDIPYTKDYLMSTILCNSCGYKHTDFYYMSEQDPVRYEYLVRDKQDMRTKVVRSTTGIVEIPELGLKVEPGAFPKSWIKNIEAILLDFKEKVEFLVKNELKGEKLQKAVDLLNKINKCLTNQIIFHVRVIDQKGNSIVLPERKENLKKRTWKKQKKKESKTGMN